MNIEKIFSKTVEEFNNSQNQFVIENKPNFLIVGNGSALDSLACVNFFTRLEKNIFDNLNKEVDIINKIFSLKKEKITTQDLLDFLKDNS